ncbi:MAG: YqgE/AlgH family protein, partial [Bradymonadia bacterium]
ADDERLKLFIGYAGWGPGQLEQEIRDGAWLTTELTSQLVFDVAEPEIWDYALGTLGVNSLHLSMSTDTLQ